MPSGLPSSTPICGNDPNENPRVATLEYDQGGADQEPSRNRTKDFDAMSPQHHGGNQRGYARFDESRQHAERMEGEQPRPLLSEAGQGKLRVTQTASRLLEEFVSLSPPTSSIFSLTPTTDVNRFLSFSQEAGGNTVNYNPSSSSSKETSTDIERKQRSSATVPSGRKPSPQVISWVQLDDEQLRSAAEAFLQLPDLSSLSDEEKQDHQRDPLHSSTNNEEGYGPERRLPPRDHGAAKKSSTTAIVVTAMQNDPNEAIRARFEGLPHSGETGIDEGSRASASRHQSLVVPQHTSTNSCDQSLPSQNEFSSEQRTNIAARVMDENGTQSFATSFNGRSSASGGVAIPATGYFFEPSSYSPSSSSFHSMATVSTTAGSTNSRIELPQKQIKRRGGGQQQGDVPSAFLPSQRTMRSNEDGDGSVDKKEDENQPTPFSSHVSAQQVVLAIDRRKSAKKTGARATGTVGRTNTNSRSEGRGQNEEGDNEKNEEQQQDGKRGGESGNSADESVAARPAKGNSSTVLAYQNFDQWNARLQDLLDYKAEHGHCNVPFCYDEKPFLAPWVKRQRYQYKCKVKGKHSHLTDERERMLEDLGFVWDTHVAAWEENFERMVEFYKMHGHCYVPIKQKELSTWAKRQRRHYKQFQDAKNKPTATMTEDRIQRLNSINFPWMTTSRIPSATPAAEDVPTVATAIAASTRKKPSGGSLTNRSMFADEPASRRMKQAPPLSAGQVTTRLSRATTNEAAATTEPPPRESPPPERNTMTMVTRGAAGRRARRNAAYQHSGNKVEEDDERDAKERNIQRRRGDDR